MRASRSVNIPLMKKTGYKPEFAAAFLMAENIGVGLVGIVLLVQLLTKKKIKTLNV